MDLNLLDAELRRDEGVKSTIYLDSKGIPTVGVGHNCKTSPLPAKWQCPLSDDQINQLLNHDLQIVFAGLDLHIPWWRNVDEVRQRVLANMAFNMGVADLLGFKCTLAAAQRGAYVTASAAMKQSAWFREVGDRAVRLCSAMESGVMPEPT